eukprot:8869781-Pyramimonas_sp.AAC.1
MFKPSRYYNLPNFPIRPLELALFGQVRNRSDHTLYLALYAYHQTAHADALILYSLFSLVTCKFRGARNSGALSLAASRTQDVQQAVAALALPELDLRGLAIAE